MFKGVREIGVRSQESILLLKADWVSCCASEFDIRFTLSQLELECGLADHRS
jgi:hypothetical protein